MDTDARVSATCAVGFVSEAPPVHGDRGLRPRTLEQCSANVPGQVPNRMSP